MEKNYISDVKIAVIFYLHCIASISILLSVNLSIPIGDVVLVPNTHFRKRMALPLKFYRNSRFSARNSIGIPHSNDVLQYKYKFDSAIQELCTVDLSVRNTAKHR